MSAFKILLDFCSINYLELRIFQIGPKENLHLRTFRRETWIKQLTHINQVRSKSGDRCKIVDACEQKKFTCCPARAVFTFVQLFSTVRFQKSLPTARRAQCLPFLAHQSGLQSIIRDRCGKSHDALCLILVELPNTTWIYFQCNSRQISHSHHLLVDIWGRTNQGEYSLSSFVLLGSLSLLYIRC